MEEENRIKVENVCMFYEIDPAFIYTLDESGLIEIIHIADDEFITVQALNRLEKFMRLHQDLHINAGGIEAVDYLLQKIIMMQKEITGLRNRLKIYE